jgi:hypothetical protein
MGGRHMRMRERRREGVFRERRPRYLPRGGGVFGARRPRYLPARGGGGGGGRRGGGGGVLAVIVLLVIAGLVVWFVVSRSNGDTGASGSSASGAGEGTIVTSDGHDVLGASSGGADALAPYEDETVTGQGVEVQSVVSPQAFWVGPTQAQELFVYVSSGQNDEAAVHAGDRVDFGGVVRVLPVDFESRFGVTSSSGSAQLQDQGHYIEALTVTPAGS